MKVKDFKPLISERHELSACLDLFRRVGFIVFRHNTGGDYRKNKDGSERYIPYNVPGFPDISGFTTTGTAVYWEVKRKGGIPTPKQKDFIFKAYHNNCFSGIGTCEDLEKELKKEGYLK